MKHWRMFLGIALQVADALTTIAFMLVGGREGNPLVAAAIGAFGLVQGLALVKSVGIFAVYKLRNRPIFLNVHNVIFSLVVLWNLLGLYFLTHS